MYLQHLALNTSRHSLHWNLRRPVNGPHIRIVCVITVKPFCVLKPSHLCGIAEVGQTPVTWARCHQWPPSHIAQWPHTATSTASRGLGTLHLCGLLHPTGKRSMKMIPSPAKGSKTKTLKSTGVLSKPLSFFFSFFFFLFLQTRAHSMWERGWTTAWVGVGEFFF